MDERTAGDIQLILPSDLRHLGLVDGVLQSVARDLGWEGDAIDNLSTAVLEAAANAIEHGNRLDAAKRVWITLRPQGTGLEIEVEDEGSGFDPQPYERELTDADLLKPRGRGIFIMRSFVDRMDFAHLPGGGMRVRLRKAGPSAGDASTGGR